MLLVISKDLPLSRSRPILSGRHALWQPRLNNVISAFPITYTVNGKQYVAVAAGGGSTMSKALATLTPEIQNPDGGSVLWVFALPN